MQYSPPAALAHPGRHLDGVAARQLQGVLSDGWRSPTSHRRPPQRCHAEPEAKNLLRGKDAAFWGLVRATRSTPPAYREIVRRLRLLSMTPWWVRRDAPLPSLREHASCGALLTVAGCCGHRARRTRGSNACTPINEADASCGVLASAEPLVPCCVRSACGQSRSLDSLRSLRMTAVRRHWRSTTSAGSGRARRPTSSPPARLAWDCGCGSRAGPSVVDVSHRRQLRSRRFD